MSDMKNKLEDELKGIGYLNVALQATRDNSLYAGQPGFSQAVSVAIAALDKRANEILEELMGLTGKMPHIITSAAGLEIQYLG